MTSSYAGLDDIKALSDVTGTTYNTVLAHMAARASRLIDEATGWRFYPEVATQYFDGSGANEQWLPEPLLAITSLTMSDDNGYSYGNTLDENTDYWTSNGTQYGQTPAQLLVMNPNGSYATFYSGRRSLQLAGIWGYRRRYSTLAWASVDALAASVTASATSLTVADADGVDERGLTPRFQVGQLIRLENEYCLVTAVAAAIANVLTVRRGQCGSSAATHAIATAVEIWRPEELVVQATTIQAVRWFKRGQSAFQDVAAAAELGQLTFARKIDPEVEFMLVEAGLRRLSVG